MSRHKLVKQLDLAEELDDYDGGSDYGDDDSGLSAEDKEQLQLGSIQVRNVLGPEVCVSEKEIYDALYYYYYDVEKSVNYILSTLVMHNFDLINTLINQEQKLTTRPGKAKSKKLDQAPAVPDASVSSKRPTRPDLLSRRSMLVHFFKDAPWLDVPMERRAEIIAEPVYPPGRLLGGSSQENRKVSKLAALAATRRKKENAKPASDNVNSSVALLDKLKSPQATPITTAAASQATAIYSKDSAWLDSRPSSRRFPIRAKARTKSTPQEDQHVLEGPVTRNNELAESPEVVTKPVASPSPFAITLLAQQSPLLKENKQTQDRETSIPRRLPYYYSIYSSETNFTAFEEPSPDDVVVEAQSSKGLKDTNTNHEKDMNKVAKAMEKTAISEIPKAKSKNLNVIAEFERRKIKPAANLVVIGHVDAGKSTLMGRLLYDLKVVDQRTLDKYRREAESIGKSSFALAWILDQGTDERSQGVTIDIGTNRFETDKTAFTILDAPGHRDFIPNMIAGASQADFAVLVIDASTGSFESGLKGQTKEHALLVRSMGVQRIIVAVNKLDTLDWSKERFDEIQQQVLAFLTAAGFQSGNIDFLPCSGLTGDNIVRSAIDARASWYSGPPLINLLELSQPLARALDKPLRLSVDDVFRGGVQNALSVSGRIDAGSVQVGDVVVVIPSGETASVKSIEVDLELKDWAVAGQNVILHLAEIDQKYLKTGGVICPPSAPINPLSRFTMKVLAFEHILPMAIEVHKGRLHAPGRISSLVAVLDKATGKATDGGRKKVKIVKPGNVARVVVEMDEAVPLEVGARIVLRAGGQTVGAGLLE